MSAGIPTTRRSGHPTYLLALGGMPESLESGEAEAREVWDPKAPLALAAEAMGP